MIIGIYFHDTTGRVRNQGPIGVLVFVLLAVSISALVYRFIEEPARCKLNPRSKLQPAAVATQPPPQPVPA
jgi:peptidoglycan/LPS O-acetylase OafA/YrhL